MSYDPRVGQLLQRIEALENRLNNIVTAASMSAQIQPIVPAAVGYRPDNINRAGSSPLHARDDYENGN